MGLTGSKAGSERKKWPRTNSTNGEIFDPTISAVTVTKDLSEKVYKAIKKQLESYSPSAPLVGMVDRVWDEICENADVKNDISECVTYVSESENGKRALGEFGVSVMDAQTKRNIDRIMVIVPHLEEIRRSACRLYDYFFKEKRPSELDEKDLRLRLAHLRVDPLKMMHGILDDPSNPLSSIYEKLFRGINEFMGLCNQDRFGSYYRALVADMVSSMGKIRDYVYSKRN